MALEKSHKESYKSQLEAGIQTAEKSLERQIGKEGVTIQEAIKSAKSAIEKSRGEVVAAIESRGETGLDAAIEAGKFIKIINDRAKEAIAKIDENSKMYERRHQAHIDFAKFRAENIANEKVYNQIWGVVNRLEGERGGKKAGDFPVNVSNLASLQHLELNLRDLESFCDEARTVRFAILEPAAEELKRIQANLGDADPALAKKIDEMLASVNEKIDSFREGEGLYDKKLAEAKAALPAQIEKAEADAKKLQLEFMEKQKSAKEGRGNVDLKDAYGANKAYMEQLRFVRQLKGYVRFLGEKVPTGYGPEEVTSPGRKA